MIIYSFSDYLAAFKERNKPNYVRYHFCGNIYGYIVLALGLFTHKNTYFVVRKALMNMARLLGCSQR